MGKFSMIFNEPLIYAPKTVIQCSSALEAVLLLQYERSMLDLWDNDETYWEEMKEETCYNLTDGSYGVASRMADFGYKVLQFSDVCFISQDPNPTYSHIFTVGDLKRAIKNKADDMIVNIERIEDVYFKKHGWESVTHQWNPDDPSDTTEFLPAFGTASFNGNFIITAHY